MEIEIEKLLTRKQFKTYLFTLNKPELPPE